MYPIAVVNMRTRLAGLIVVPGLRLLADHCIRRDEPVTWDDTMGIKCIDGEERGFDVRTLESHDTLARYRTEPKLPTFSNIDTLNETHRDKVSEIRVIAETDIESSMRGRGGQQDGDNDSAVQRGNETKGHGGRVPRRRCSDGTDTLKS